MNEHDIEKLLKSAGPLTEPDKNMMNDVKAATQLAWQEVVEARKRKKQHRIRTVFASCAAAILCVAIGIRFLSNNPLQHSQNTIVAEVIHTDGTIVINKNQVHELRDIAIGDLVATGSSGSLSIRLKDQTTIAFSSNTTLRLANSSTLNLEHGRIYIDSPDINTSVTVITPWGNIKDIGTQYEVNIKQDSLEVAMRSGKVAVDLGEKVLYALAENGYGDVIALNKNNEFTKRTLASSDAHWDWTRKSAQPLIVEGKTVGEVLNWTGLITGKSIEYATPAARDAAVTTVLSGGELAPISAEKTLSTLLKTTHFVAHISSHSIELELRTDY